MSKSSGRACLRMTAVAAAACSLTFASVQGAFAYQQSVTGNVTSTSSFTTFPASFTAQHDGDDFGYQPTSGIDVEGRWRKCGTSTVGATHTPMVVGLFQTLGTNFKRTTCLHLDLRGLDRTGTSSGTVYYNYSWK
jgi:hypothetical protein